MENTENSKDTIDQRLLEEVQTLRIKQRKSREEVHSQMEKEVMKETLESILDKVELADLKHRIEDAENKAYFGIMLILGGIMGSFSKIGFSFHTITILGLMLFRIAKKSLREVKEEIGMRDEQNLH